jgi:hypothetical protein
MLAPRGRSRYDREARAKRAMRRGVFYIVFLILVLIAIKWPQLILRYLP